MMLKKKNNEVPEESTAIVETSDELPEFVPREAIGTEHITRDDIRIPRLCLAQALSPQLQEGDSAYIPDLKFGDMFNDVSDSNYGKETLRVIVVCGYPPRYVEFAPRETGGGVIEANVPAGDPRTKFTTDENGKRVKPIATKFYDYVALLVDHGFEPVGISFKSSGLKAAVRLNTLIKLKPGPIFAYYYALTPVKISGDQGTWYVFNVRPAGAIQEEQTYKMAEQAHNLWKVANVTFEIVDDSEAIEDDSEM